MAGGGQLNIGPVRIWRRSSARSRTHKDDPIGQIDEIQVDPICL